MAGRAPLEDLALEICTSDAGLSELALINRGEADAWTSELAPLHVRADRPWLAHDALAWFEAEAHEDTLVLEASSHRRIAPGESLAIAWLRFEGPAELELDFPTTPCTRD